MYKYMDKKKAGKEKAGAGHNRTGIPVQLKRRVEENTGFSLDDVRVHYDSDKPSKLDALAYTQGNQVYIGPGQERHLPHELGHVVQQKSGLVQPNERHHSGVDMNTDQFLEAQADRIGAGQASASFSPSEHMDGAAGAEAPVQRKVGMEFQTYKGQWNIMKLKDARNLPVVEESIRRGEQEDAFWSMLEVPEVRNDIYEDAAGFSVSMDGPDLEYITKPFDERRESGQLTNAASQAGEMHKNIPGTRPAFAQEDVGNYYKVSLRGEVYYINKNGERTAHPQATVGVKYEQIPDLVERIATAGEDSVLYQDVPSAKISRDQIIRSRESIDSFDGLDHVPDKEKCKAFLQITEQYLMAASEKHDRIGSTLAAGALAIKNINDAVKKEANAVNRMNAFQLMNLNTEKINKLCYYENMFTAGKREGGSILGELGQLPAGKEERLKKRRYLCDKANGALSAVKDAAAHAWDNVEAELNKVPDSRTITSDFDKLNSSNITEELENCIYGYYTQINSAISALEQYWKTHSGIKDCENIQQIYNEILKNKPVWFEHYFKTLLSIKSRTSLYDLYRMLSPEGQQAVFQYLDGDESGRSKYDFIYEDWDFHSGNGMHLYSVGYGEWKKSMQEKGKDPLCYELEEGREDLRENKEHFGVKRSTDIGHDDEDAGTVIEGALLELRKLKGEIAPEEWGTVAQNICQLINEIHRPPIAAGP